MKTSRLSPLGLVLAAGLMFAGAFSASAQTMNLRDGTTYTLNSAAPVGNAGYGATVLGRDAKVLGLIRQLEPGSYVNFTAAHRVRVVGRMALPGAALGTGDVTSTITIAAVDGMRPGWTGALISITNSLHSTAPVHFFVRRQSSWQRHEMVEHYPRADGSVRETTSARGDKLAVGGRVALEHFFANQGHSDSLKASMNVPGSLYASLLAATDMRGPGAEVERRYLLTLSALALPAQSNQYPAAVLDNVMRTSLLAGGLENPPPGQDIRNPSVSAQIRQALTNALVTVIKALGDGIAGLLIRIFEILGRLFG